MIVDFRSYDGPDPIEADLCIVGAGAAGITMALAFAGSPLRVCVVESGGLSFDDATQSLYRGEIAGLPFVSLDRCRLRMFGGTTNHWGGWSAPYQELDFEKRDWVPHSGWPITRAELDPYYPRAQELCGLGPFVYDEDVWKEIGISPAPPDRRRFEITFLRVSRQQFGLAYRQDLALADNVQILLNANVVNIAANETATAVTQLDLRSLEGRTARVTARSYVLACGGIENARLLLLSNQVQPRGLGNQRDLVGRFFMDHPPMDWPPPSVRCATVVSSDGAGLIGRFGTYDQGDGGRRYVTGLRLPTEVQRSRRVLNCCGWLNGDWPELPGGPAAVGVARMLLRMGTLNGARPQVTDSAAAADQSYPTTISLVSQSEQAPNPDSRVTLSDERDALGLRRVRLSWRMTELDKHSVRVWAELIGAELTRLNTGRVRMDDWLLDDNAGWPADLQGAWHHIGTTKMASDPSQGVVDSNCRVHGIANLYIAGCSVFPTSSWVNPTLTIVAFAVRLAEHLRTRLSESRAPAAARQGSSPRTVGAA